MAARTAKSGKPGKSRTSGKAREKNRGEDARARLLDAAVTAFASRGYHGTSTRDIAAGGGMSPAALYVHYRTKQELLAHIAISGHEATLRMIRDAIATSHSPTAQLVATVRGFASHHARANTVARVVNYELASLEAEAATRVRELRREISAEVRALVDRGIAAGQFDCPGSRIAATALLSLGIDIARWYREDGTWSPEDLGDEYAAIALRIVGAASPPG